MSEIFSNLFLEIEQRTNLYGRTYDGFWGTGDSSIDVLHVNETVFEHPEKIDPQRFIRDEKLLQKVIPFGIGKRTCLGESLSRFELHLIFGNLLLRYKLQPHGELSTKNLMPYSAGKRPFKLEMQFINILCILYLFTFLLMVMYSFQ